MEAAKSTTDQLWRVRTPISSSGSEARTTIRYLNHAGVPAHATPEQAIRAFMHLVSYADNLQALYDRAAVLYAFEQLGGAQRALDMAVEYAKERFAFSRAICS